MTKVTLNDEMKAKLAGLEHPTMLCDETGELLGWFHPQSQFFAQPTREELLASCPDSEEELERRSQNRENSRLLADVLRDLETS